MRSVQIVPFVKKEAMREYFNDYLTELSEFDPDIKFDNYGKPIYKWFEHYWQDKDRYPLYFKVDGEIAGLAMIRELNFMLYDIAEFYVLPKYRKDGNAIWFASKLTELFDGEFTFGTRFTNPRAIKFWGKFSKLFDANSYIDDDIWRTWTIKNNSFKNYELHLMSKYYDLIKSEEKTLEGRLYKNEKKNYKIGDTLTFYKEPNNKESLNAIILNIYRFDNFEDMAKSLDKKDLGFANSSNEEMIKTYRTIYSKQDELKYGVVVFKIKVIY